MQLVCNTIAPKPGPLSDLSGLCPIIILPGHRYYHFKASSGLGMWLKW